MVQEGRGPRGQGGGPGWGARDSGGSQRTGRGLRGQGGDSRTGRGPRDSVGTQGQGDSDTGGGSGPRMGRGFGDGGCPLPWGLPQALGTTCAQGKVRRLWEALPVLGREAPRTPPQGVCSQVPAGEEDRVTQVTCLPCKKTWCRPGLPRSHWAVK